MPALTQEFSQPFPHLFFEDWKSIRPTRPSQNILCQFGRIPSRLRLAGREGGQMTIARGKVLFPDIPSFEFYVLSGCKLQFCSWIKKRPKKVAWVPTSQPISFATWLLSRTSQNISQYIPQRSSTNTNMSWVCAFWLGTLKRRKVGYFPRVLSFPPLLGVLCPIRRRERSEEVSTVSFPLVSPKLRNICTGLCSPWDNRR